MQRVLAFIAAVGAQFGKLAMSVLVLMMLQSQTARAASPLIGLLFQEVDEVHLTKQGEQIVVAVKGKAWMWNHNINFRITDASGRQCLNNFLDMLNSAPRTKQLQFGGYYSGQTVDQQGRTTTTEINVMTECYFR